MVFSSILFLLLFLPFFFLIYPLIPAKGKNLFALFGSLVFYAWGGPKFIGVILGLLFIDYFIVSWMAKSAKPKIFLALSVALNVGSLLYFKYANFFVDNVIHVFDIPMDWMEVALPIGISFYTFQKLSYTIDVYAKRNEPLKSMVDYFLYIMLFPQMIAGPIVRYQEIAGQLKDRKEGMDDRIMGLFRFAIGLGKKVLIANVLAQKADFVFSLNYADLSPGMAWLGLVFYALQIYFDFAGYSDMAIGLGRMMGFRFPENFNNPYISQSISEFWRRWHITLGRWMKDYLYIPLGGSQVSSTFRLYFNLWIVFLVSGFWHGASWNFLIWGAYHGLFLIADRLFLDKLGKYISKFGRIALTLFFTLLGWVFFRVTDFSDSLQFFASLFGQTTGTIGVSISTKEMSVFALAMVFSLWYLIPTVKNKLDGILNLEKIGLRQMTLLVPVIIVCFYLSISSLMNADFNPFIYFRF
ncbi:MAG: alginate O-acetyltransferase complex protein AlgI [Sphingobacteriales bacterium]|jgi:alginate O-acetyltransferase complex protein AlgI